MFLKIKKFYNNQKKIAQNKDKVYKIILIIHLKNHLKKILKINLLLIQLFLPKKVQTNQLKKMYQVKAILLKILQIYQIHKKNNKII